MSSPVHQSPQSDQPDQSDRPDEPVGLRRWWAWPAAVVGVGLALARRPSLWGTAARQARVLAPPGWWRRAPFLPIPPLRYLRFRLQTAYGGDGRGPFRPAEVVTYLVWCRRWRRSGFG